MECGKAKYIEGLLKSKKIRKVENAFEFVKLVNKEVYRPHVEERWEVHTYKNFLEKVHREYLDAIATLNNVEWFAKSESGLGKMKIVIYTPFIGKY